MTLPCFATTGKEFLSGGSLVSMSVVHQVRLMPCSKTVQRKAPFPVSPHMGDGGLMPDASRGFINNMSRLKWLILNDAEFVPILIPRSKVIEYRAAFEASPER